jgi:hypothetical protein
MGPDGDGLATFAAHVVGAPGARDGLYRPEGPGAPASPVGDPIARAAAEGRAIAARKAEPEPYLGRCFRVPTRHGPAAAVGAGDWVVDGHPVGGDAMLAFPSDPRGTGIMSLMVAKTGAVREADLAPDTSAAAAI